MNERRRKVWYPGKTNPGTLQRARELRQDATEAEEVLWDILRKRPGGYKFRRQHPIGKYIVDFYSAEIRLAIELDGSIHDSAEQAASDKWRQSVIATHKIEFLRFKNEEVMTDAASVTHTIVNRCNELNSLNKKNPISPSPSGRGT